MAARPIMGVYTSRPRNGKFGKFPASRAQTTGDRNILAEQKKTAVKPPETNKQKNPRVIGEV